jgi:hypothetical protein
MRIKCGPEFGAERERYQLRFCCEHCTYFDPGRDRCVHGWPNREHREERYREKPRDEVVFCKEFELL